MIRQRPDISSPGSTTPKMCLWLCQGCVLKWQTSLWHVTSDRIRLQNLSWCWFTPYCPIHYIGIYVYIYICHIYNIFYSPTLHGGQRDKNFMIGKRTFISVTFLRNHSYMSVCVLYYTGSCWFTRESSWVNQQTGCSIIYCPTLWKCVSYSIIYCPILWR